MRSSFHERLDGVKYAARGRVFRQYGLQDLFREHEIAPSAPGVYNKLVGVVKSIGEMGRDTYFGSPVTMLERINRNYKATKSVPRAVGRYFKDSFISPSSVASTALMLGLPTAFLASSIASAPEEERGATLAKGLLNIGASPVLGRLGQTGMDLQQAVLGGNQPQGLSDQSIKPRDY